MPDTRRHRGPHPEDARHFSAGNLHRLRRAVAELSWLLTRDYAEASALKLVGDRHQLTARQRTAVLRCSCSDGDLAARQARRCSDGGGAPLAIDGYNVLITVESALAGGLVLIGRDGACRDLASLHGSYRRVEETERALVLIGEHVAASSLPEAVVTWYLDAPVSNSGRLAALMRDLAAAREWSWDVEVTVDPDGALMSSPGCVATSDSQVLNGCAKWRNLARELIQRRVDEAWMVDLSREDS